MKTVCFVFARGGSKGLPGKNIKPLSGKPLIAHSILTAKAAGLSEVIVSTDCQNIAHVARQWGAETPFERPAELATDTASEWKAWQHAITWYQQNRGDFDVFISLPATAPMRATEDVLNCLTAIQGDPLADVVITVRQAERNPYFNMVKLDSEGYASLFAKLPGGVTRRQDAPAVFDITTVAYAARPGFVLRHSGLFEGRVKTVEVPNARALDIDTAYDFDLAQAMMATRDKDKQ
ncbi:MAG TPA: acylneuraminate cytidylyltransferase family protein [Limnobacter sp.]|nr:acylneuraminate cytidylyltransferase family protein [Limnobacter sp.]